MVAHSAHMSKALRIAYPDTLSPRQAKVADALSAVIEAADLGARDALHIFRVLGEQLPLEEDDANGAFERVRLRSIGVEEELRQLEGGGLSDAEFAKRLGVGSRETVRKYREKGWLFAWEKDSRNLRYPAWQVHEGRLLPGLAEVLAILHHQKRGSFSIANYFLSESEELGGRRPLDLLREGRLGDVKAHAERNDVGA